MVKKLNVSERGQWLDKLVIPAIALGVLLSVAGFLMAFLFVAPVNGAALSSPELVGELMVTHQQLLSQKILYFHMPVALVSFAALGFAAFFGVRFLMTQERGFDTRSRVAMEITLLFVVMTMITGDLWTRFEWGVWWTWEPRLTTYLILTLIVIAYFVLRSGVDEPERRSTYAAIMSIIAFVDVPICFMVTRLIPSSIHPVITREGGMTPDMVLTVAIIMVGMAFLAFALYRLRFCQLGLSEQVEVLQKQLGDEE